MAKRHSNKVGDFESLFLRLEELVLANSGEDEFEEVLKLLIAKLADELGEAKAKFKPHETPAKTHQVVTDLLREADRRWPEVLLSPKMKLSPEHTHVCVEALSHHAIGASGLHVMDSFFEFLVSRAAKGQKGQYFTPRHVIDLCVKLLRPRSNELVLDPACGSGGFLFHALENCRASGELKKGDQVRTYCENNIWGFDLDARAIRVARTLFVICCGHQPNLFLLNSLLRPPSSSQLDLVTSGSQSVLMIEDIFRTRVKNFKGFDVILTNPPFAGDIRERHLLDNYQLSNGKHQIERDVLFVERCIELLRPGGRMAIVLPHNKFASSSFSYLREWLFRKTQICGVIGLGRNTFLPHTHQKANILLVKKLQKETLRPIQGDIFFAISEKEGKNSRGQYILREDPLQTSDPWTSVDHDFENIVSEFESYRSNHQLF